MLLDFAAEARMLFDALREVYKTYGKYVGHITFSYWCNAVGESTLA